MGQMKASSLLKGLRLLGLSAALVFSTAGSLIAACTATKQNADYGEVGSGTTATLSTGGGHTATINAVGDLVVFSAWCFQNCTFGALTMGSQTAVRTSTVTPGTTQGMDSLFTGQAAIYYILSSAASGNQAITLHVSGGSSSQSQVSYIDYGLSAGCIASHNIDSSVGSATGGGTASTPSISGVTGNVLFSFTITTQHVTSPVNSPWSCPVYSGSGETQTCNINTTQNGAAYILSASSGTISNNWTLINSSTGYEAIIASFSLNSCPSGVPSGVTTCYFVSAGGLDTNAGTDESHPWVHSPGMANCASTCGTVQTSFGVSGSTKAGVGIIFRGGDTWHVGNSGAAPYTGVNSNCDGGGTPCAVTLTWSGTSGAYFYYGVDKSWFSGGSWTRPIFNGDNPASTSGVGSCTHDESNESFIMIYAVPIAYVYLDNFEFTGICWSGTSANAKYISLKANSNAATNRVVANLAIHGWTHVTFNGSNLDGGTGISGSTDRTFGGGDQYINDVCDGSDSDSQSFFCVFGGGYDIHNSVFRYASNGVVVNNAHVFHDNLLEHIQKTSDGVAHGNVVEFNVEWQTVNAIYNNVLRNQWDTGCAGEVQFWETPHSTDYTFNNLAYGNPCGAGNYWNEIGASGGGDSGWTADLFNNTFIVSANAPHIAGPPSDGSVNFYNNHCETPSGGTAADCSSFQGTENYLTNLNQSTATDTAQGYTAAQTFAYSPTAGGNSTSGAGTNEISLCNALTGSADALLQLAGNACKNDTGYACAYNSGNYTVTCPARTPMARPASAAWDIGAYEFGGGGSLPQPPTNLIVTPGGE